MTDTRFRSAGARKPVSGSRYYQPPRISVRQKSAAASIETDDKSAPHIDAVVPGFTRAVIMAYLCALMFPATFRIGSVALTGTRAFLTVALIPALIAAFRRERIGACDILILLYATWAAICFFANQGLVDGIEPAGSHFVEVAGSYFLARILFKTPETFVFWSKCLFTCVITLIPPAIYETITARPIILDALRSVLSVYPNVEMPQRLGLDRAQVVFEHPILFGVFCAGAFSPAVFLVARQKSTIAKLLLGTVVSFATFLSFSSGAYLNIIWQLAVLLWNRIFKQVKTRWRRLVFLSIAAYFIVDALSNRTPFEVFITYFTFDVGSAYTRVLQWKYGTETVFENPILGLGLFSDYPRPEWLTPSIDNFWLLRAMRFGFPGIALLLSAVFAALNGVAHRIDGNTPLWSTVSIAQLSMLIGSAVSLITVDVWSGTHSLFFFSIGTVVALNESFRAVDHQNQSIT